VARPAWALRGETGRAWHGRARAAGPGAWGVGGGGAAGGRRAWGVNGGAGRGACGGLARDIYLAMPRHGSERGSAAPRSVARQALPRQRSVISVAATSALCRATMHGAAQAFCRTRAIGVAKNVSF